jgi:small subunit ribosomal protein S9
LNDEPQNANEAQEPTEVPPEDAPESDAPAEEPTADAEPAPEAEDAAEEAPESEDAAEEQAPQAEGAAEEAPPAEAAPKPDDEGKKKGDVAPGAELDPIALEPEPELDAEERARLEAEAEEQKRRERELEEVEQPVSVKPAKLHADSRYTATGKRKSSVARVIISAGGGAILVNSRKLEEYFPRPYLQSVAKQPLVQTGYDESVDVRVRVHGGGVSGQASAVRHGIAKALCDVDPELRRELKRRGMLTRDARIKERRKAGLKKARKRPQFSKR